MTNPPQRFCNLLDGDPLGQSMDFVLDVLSYLQDALDLACCIGTGWVAQRSAIEEIGGIPTEAILEDVLTSVLLNAKAAYVHENVQWGRSRQICRLGQTDKTMGVRTGWLCCFHLEFSD